MVTNIHFENFRGFTDLKLDGLKRINLIVGRNNAGKTSLLEGIVIATDSNRIGEMPGLLRASVGEVGLRYFRWLVKDSEKVREAKLRLSGPAVHCETILKRRTGNEQVTAPSSAWNQVFASGGVIIFASRDSSKIRCRVLSVQHQHPNQLVKLFAQAVKRKGGEDRLEKLLNTVDNRIQKVRVEPADDGNHLMVDIGLSEMLPLSQVGQGLYRLVAIFSELIGEQPQLCIIDEVENGIHHSLLEEVWKGLAAVVEETTIQIFLTTHSQACIEAAHAAFAKRDNYDFGIVQLFRIEGGVQGRVLDRKHIEAAITGEIDLR